MSRPNIVRDAWTWGQEARRRCADVGVAFIFDPNVPGPCTDGHTIRVPPLPEDASQDDLTLLRHAVIHECGHHLRPEAFAIAKSERLKPNSPLMVLLNIVEDAAQERASAVRWRGDRASLAAGHRTMCSRQIAKVASDGPPAKPAPDEAHKYAAAVGVTLVAGSDWSPDMVAMAAPWAAALDVRMPGTAQLFTDLIREGWDARVRAVDTVAEAYALAREMFARLFPGESEEESKQPEKSEESDGDGDKAGKGKKAKGAKDGDGKATGAGDGRATERGDGEDSDAGGVIPWELIYHSDHATPEDGASESGHALTRIDFTGKSTEGAPTFHTSQKAEKVSATAGSTATARSYPFPAPLINTVRRLLQARTRVRWDHERTEGRLDKRNLTRVVMPRVGDGTFNKSVFQRRAESMSLDVCVTVLVDCSGSMKRGGKYEKAAEAAMCLSDLAAGSLRVPCEILGFTTHHADDGPRYYEFKTYAERRVAREVIGARLLAIREDSRSLWGNADGDAVLWAASRMRDRREARRILVVLSDGSPTDAATGGDADVNLTAAIRAVRAGGACEVYGIGILDSNVRRYYSPTAPVITDVAEIPAALVAVLSDVLQHPAARRSA